MKLYNTVESISVVVPVYNSQKTLPELIQRLESVIADLVPVYEVILINDCSHDKSWDVICQLGQTKDWIKGINLMRNYGQHNALLCGIRAAKHEVIVTIDDDLQNPPEEIPKLLHKLYEGFDVVYGTPQTQQHGFLRNIASRITKLSLRSAMGVEIAKHVSAFRAFGNNMRDVTKNYQSPFISIDVLLSWGTTRFAAVPVSFDLRRVGSSNYTFRMLVNHALNMMTGFSILPLQLATLMGFVFTIFGIFILIFVIGRYLIEGGSVPGFPFIASIIAIFSGAQMFAIGIIGEYLARMHFRMMERPTYLVRETFNKSKQM